MNDVLRMALDRIEAVEREIANHVDLIKDQRERITILDKLVGDQNRVIADLQTNLAATNAAITANAETAVRASDAFNAQIAIVAEAVNANKAEAAAGLTDIVSQMENHRIETATLVSRLRDPLPKQLMINQAGVLVAIDHAGDVREIGNVTGAPGRDAPRIEAAGWKAGHIVLSMSDRTSHLVEIPAPAVNGGTVPAPVITQRTPEGDEVKASIRMGIAMEAAANGKSVKSVAAIAKRYNLKPVMVRAIIREHENEAKLRGAGSASQ